MSVASWLAGGNERVEKACFGMPWNVGEADGEDPVRGPKYDPRGGRGGEKGARDN